MIAHPCLDDPAICSRQQCRVLRCRKQGAQGCRSCQNPCQRLAHCRRIQTMTRHLRWQQLWQMTILGRRSSCMRPPLPLMMAATPRPPARAWSPCCAWMMQPCRLRMDQSSVPSSPAHWPVLWKFRRRSMGRSEPAAWSQSRASAG